MPTRMERLQASLEKEERKTDLKRLKKVQEYLGFALTIFAKDFHGEHTDVVIRPIRIAISDCSTEINNLISSS